MAPASPPARPRTAVGDLCPHVMKAARQLLLTTDIYIAHMSAERDGWLDLYSHEPFEKCRKVLRDIVVAIRPFLNCRNEQWEFRLFCQDGYLCCYSNGLRMDSDGDPVEGSDIFSE